MHPLEAESIQEYAVVEINVGMNKGNSYTQLILFFVYSMSVSLTMYYVPGFHREYLGKQARNSFCLHETYSLGSEKKTDIREADTGQFNGRAHVLFGSRRPRMKRFFTGDTKMRVIWISLEERQRGNMRERIQQVQTPEEETGPGWVRNSVEAWVTGGR